MRVLVRLCFCAPIETGPPQPRSSAGEPKRADFQNLTLKNPVIIAAPEAVASAMVAAVFKPHLKMHPAPGPALSIQ